MMDPGQVWGLSKGVRGQLPVVRGHEAHRNVPVLQGGEPVAMTIVNRLPTQ